MDLMYLFDVINAVYAYGRSICRIDRKKSIRRIRGVDTPYRSSVTQKVDKTMQKNNKITQSNKTHKLN